MTALNDRFWAKVLFKNFIKHYRKLSNEERLADIEASMDALEDLDDSGSSFGAKMVKWSMERVDQYPQASANGKKGGRPRKTTAGAKNGNNGDESTTAFENMRRVPQNEDPSHGFSGGDRPAQGSMSLPPSWAAHDGNILGSARPSTEAPTRKNGDEHQTGCKTGASESATSVDKTNSVCNTGSVQPVTRRESGDFSVSTLAMSTRRRTGGLLPSSSLNPPVRPGAVDVLNLAYSGEFQNVKLTQEQYAQLGIRFGNLAKLNRAIDSLSSKLENNEITPTPKNHYALLVKWASYRDDMEEQKIQQSETPKMTEMEKSWIREAEKIARYEKELAANERR